MKNQVRILFLLLFFGAFLQSCQKEEGLTDDLVVDELATTETDAAIIEARFNGNGPNPGGNNGGNVDRLDNEVVYEWTQLMLELDRYATGMRPTATARAFAYIYLASYETAVPGMRDHGSNLQRLPGLQIANNQLPGRIDWEIALNSCFAKTMAHFIFNIPASSEVLIGELESKLEEEYSAGVSDNMVADSKAWGAYVADKVIAFSQTDLEAETQILDPQPTSYVPPTGDGLWLHSAEEDRSLYPYWGSVRTFVIRPNETRTIPPIAYSEDANSPYFADMMECYVESTTAKEQNNEQLWIAEFWSDDVEGLMFSPPARQYSISNQLIQKYDTDLEQTLAFYLKLGFSLNDAAVATWKYKYQYNVMRPNEFIHEFIDPDFQTNLYRLVYWPNPGFPGYPSGHSAFASAAAGVFIAQYGNNVNFTDRSHEGRTEFNGEPRSFTSFRELAAENAYSRIPLGVHMRMDCREGLRLGYEISAAINKLDLERRRGGLAFN